MKYYQTDEHGFLVGEFDADESPLEPGVYLIPRGGIADAPPIAGPDQAAKYEAGAWSLVPDHRGTVYWLGDRSRHEITERGIAPPADALQAEPPPPLNEVQSAALSAIDAAAGAARARYITVSAGQEATYMLKESNARDYQTAGYPAASVAAYPMVQAEAEAIYGATPTAAQIQSAADAVVAQADAWIAKAAQIERARIGGKRAVAAASDLAAVAAARAVAEADLGAM